MKEENNSQLSILNSPLIPPGYKQTEVGVIPEDWKITTLKTLMRPERKITYGIVVPGPIVHNGVPIIRAQDYSKGWVDLDELYRVSPKIDQSYKRSRVITGDILLTIVGCVGNLAKVPNLFDGSNLTQQTARLSFNTKTANADYFLNILHSKIGKREISNYTKSGVQPSLNLSDVEQFLVPLPTLPEQEAIAKALSDADALIESLEQLLAKKRQIKQGAMQELLTGKKRLPGFSGKWEVKTLQEATDCLDNLRVPLNESQRDKMRGDYPYCGANGILDYVDDYVIDDDIILMAEDGGYFDEYAYRPIAYRMVGKCWVNNHAHILKAKPDYDHGFIFYSLVHKNILSYLASGTRAKLNKSEMSKIEVRLPLEKQEQTAIAAILRDMDAEIAALEIKLAKARQLKQGMMQELLTGRIRLV